VIWDHLCFDLGSLAMLVATVADMGRFSVLYAENGRMADSMGAKNG
jgi:hypothetical protein